MMECNSRNNGHKKKMGKYKGKGLPRGAVDKNLPANAGDTDSFPGPGRSHTPWSN